MKTPSPWRESPRSAASASASARAPGGYQSPRIRAAVPIWCGRIVRRWGRYFEVRLPAATPGAVDLACRALDLIEALEAQLTVYRDDSEVSRLNATAHLGPVAVERGLFGLLESAVALSRETDGAYDVTSGALSEAWGFVKGPKRVPDEAVLADARARTGWQHLRLDPELPTVAFDREGVRINLGSIGKGYAIDRAVDVIRAPLVADFGPGARRAVEPLCAGLAAGSVRRAVGNRAAQSVRAGDAAGHAAAAESRARDLGRGVPAVRRRRARSTANHRPAVGRAGRWAGQRDGAGAHGRPGRRPFDGLLSARARGRRALTWPSIPRSAWSSSRRARPEHRRACSFSA